MSVLILDAFRQIHARIVVLVAIYELRMEDRVLGLAIPLPFKVDVVRGFGEIGGAPCEFTCEGFAA
ncbi:hypothetical protein PoHVEF18_008020 [Penicillium ochrochloron]